MAQGHRDRWRKPLSAMSFLSRDSTRGFIVEQGAFSFHTTEYETFDQFSEQFFTGLGIVHECLVLDYSERVGIRYLDAVVPPGGEDDLSKYLAPGVLRDWQVGYPMACPSGYPHPKPKS